VAVTVAGGVVRKSQEEMKDGPAVYPRRFQACSVLLGVFVIGTLGSSITYPRSSDISVGLTRGQTLAAGPRGGFQPSGSPPLPNAERFEALKVNNYARPLREFDGRMYFEWRVFIDEPPDVLDGIADVQYELHPTFDQRFQVRSDPKTKFALDRGGWGEFRMPIMIRYKDGRIEQLSYALDFTKPWPANEPK
jgi:pYEATS domain-containing protein involved in immunity